MKALIVEDEPLSAVHLKTLLAKTAPEVDVIAMLDSVRAVVSYMKEKPALDLIFMDIHLADGLSFEIFQQIEITQPVIFTTTYDEYAIKAFKVNSVDYLLKPIGINDLKTAINKFNSQQNTHQAHHSAQNLISASLIQQNTKSRFIVKMGESLNSVRIEDIAGFVAEDGIVLLIGNEGKRFPVDYTMDALETVLNTRLFFRINRKMIIHIEQIQTVQTYFNGRLKIKLKANFSDECIVSRERVNEFKKWLDQ